jgi:hypothetical protein
LTGDGNGFSFLLMKRIQGHKFYGSRLVCALLLSALFFGCLSPCHEYAGYGTVILGYDTCDDSPYLPVEFEHASLVAVGFFHIPQISTAIPSLFAYSIFHPPQA